MMEIVVTYLVVHACIGFLLVSATASRGLMGDILFAALWPLYLYLDWKNGQL